MLKIATLATTTVLVLSGGTAAFAHPGSSHDSSDDGVRIVMCGDDRAPDFTAARPARHAEPGDDRGRKAEPGDDRGRKAEPGDDRGRHAEPGDDRVARATAADDHGRHAEPGDDHGHHGGHHGGRHGGGHGSDD